MRQTNGFAPAGELFTSTGSDVGMAEPVRIVGLGGSLAPGSTSLLALKLALGGAEQSGAVVALLDLRTLNLPLYVPGEGAIPDQVHILLATMSDADGFIWSSPQYHGTISGSFKNALDWLDVLESRVPPQLTDKVVGLISAAGGSQGVQAINTMELIVRALRGLAVPLVVPIPKARAACDEAGEMRDQRLQTQLRQLGSEVVRLTEQLRRREYGRSPLPDAPAPPTAAAYPPPQTEAR